MNMYVCLPTDIEQNKKSKGNIQFYHVTYNGLVITGTISLISLNATITVAVDQRPSPSVTLTVNV